MRFAGAGWLMAAILVAGCLSTAPTGSQSPAAVTAESPARTPFLHPAIPVGVQQSRCDLNWNNGLSWNARPISVFEGPATNETFQVAYASALSALGLPGNASDRPAYKYRQPDTPEYILEEADWNIGKSDGIGILEQQRVAVFISFAHRGSGWLPRDDHQAMEMLRGVASALGMPRASEMNFSIQSFGSTEIREFDGYQVMPDGGSQKVMDATRWDTGSPFQEAHFGPFFDLSGAHATLSPQLAGAIAQEFVHCQLGHMAQNATLDIVSAGLGVRAFSLVYRVILANPNPPGGCAGDHPIEVDVDAVTKAIPFWDDGHCQVMPHGHM